MFIEVNASMAILVTPLAPVAVAYGINEIHRNRKVGRSVNDSKRP